LGVEWAKDPNVGTKLIVGGSFQNQLRVLRLRRSLRTGCAQDDSRSREIVLSLGEISFEPKSQNRDLGHPPDGSQG